MQISETVRRLQSMIEETGDADIDWVELKMQYGAVRIAEREMNFIPNARLA